jgi:predicted ATPase
VGRVEQGLQLVAEALAFGEKTGEKVVEADLHRIRGDLLAAPGDAEDAERAAASYRRSLEVARHQQARMMELRASIGLGRLLAQGGQEAEASKLLGAVYGWFTEGFETLDLREARGLLRAWGATA